MDNCFFSLFRVFQAAEWNAHRPSKRNRKNRIWELETALAIDPEDAWRRLLLEEELLPEDAENLEAGGYGETPMPEEVVAQSSEARWTLDAAEPEPAEPWDPSDDEEVVNDNALSSFVQRQLDALS